DPALRARVVHAPRGAGREPVELGLGAQAVLGQAELLAHRLPGVAHLRSRPASEDAERRVLARAGATGVDAPTDADEIHLVVADALVLEQLPHGHRRLGRDFADDALELGR